MKSLRCVPLIAIAAYVSLDLAALAADSSALAPEQQSASVEAPPSGVDWAGLSRATGRFLAVEHGFRLLTEAGTRTGLNGPFINNYTNSVRNLHGWADGDEFYVNYVGHPMQGAVSGFLWTQHDRAYRHVPFGSGRDYWRSRIRASGFMLAYSAQFELGPVSEASIGRIQSAFPQQGFVDHVITPSIGLAWMITEDALDRYLIERIESATGNRWARRLLRSGLNPSRSFANILEGRLPWARDTRGSLGGGSSKSRASNITIAQETAVPAAALAPPFEFAVSFQPQRFLRTGEGCLGGGAAAGFRIKPSWQLITEVGGCNIMGLEKNLSGDSLTYMIGPRWIGRVRGPWNAYMQLLGGGNKVTKERMYPEVKQMLQKKDRTPGSGRSLQRSEYVDGIQDHGFGLKIAGGLSYELNPALAFTVAEISYSNAWIAPLWGRDYSRSLQWSSKLTLKMGTW